MKQRILAVDDEPHMLKLLERIVREKTPYAITTTHSSLEIPSILEKDAFDLIITDLKMPGMDGLDILRHIRERDRHEEVIIITAFGSLESAIEALSLGVFDYITKPFKKEQIIFTVNRVMRWQAMKREVHAIAAIFESEPYEQAEKLFMREYLKRLSKRSGGDEAALARRSGLSPETINAMMEHSG